MSDPIADERRIMLIKEAKTCDELKSIMDDIPGGPSE